MTYFYIYEGSYLRKAIYEETSFYKRPYGRMLSFFSSFF